MPLDKPFHRYELGVDIPATEVAVLADALDGDDVHLKHRIGRDELERQLAEQRLVIDATPAERWPDFERDFETLSTYLSEPIVAQELHAEPVGIGAPRVEGTRLLGRRGQVTRLALDVVWDEARHTVVDRGVDMEAAERRWSDLPPWVQATLKHGNTGAGSD